MVFLSPSQHLKPSEQDAQVRDNLLEELTDIFNVHFGPGFDVEYVGIGRYAADIQQAPLEFAIVVCVDLRILFRR